MNLSCSSKMIKYLMFAFNLFFVISGIIIIAVGATVKTVYTEYSYFLDTKYFTLPNLLIATGTLIFFISFFGCCGAIKESWIMLGVFSLLMILIFIFEFSAGIAGYVLRDKTADYLDTTLRNHLKTYPNESHSVWDLIQNNFQCCGVDSFKDWNGTFSDQYALPVSCCPRISGVVGAFYCNSYLTTAAPSTTVTTPAPASENLRKRRALAGGEETSPEPNSTTVSSTTVNTSVVQESTTLSPASPQGTTTSQPYGKGCKAAFGDYVRKHAVQIGGCAIGLAVIQCVGILFSCHLVRQLKNGYYST